MSEENQINDETGSGEESGADLAHTLAGGETEFVAGEDKKSSPHQLIYLMLLLALGGGGTYLMYKRSGPDTAAAASPEAAKAAQTINEFLSAGPGGIQKMQEMLKDTEKVVQQFQDYPSVTQIPLSDLQTNPFRLAAESAPKNNEAEELAKKREAEKQAAIKACAALQLQSIIHSGARKACMINNAMYREGQQIDQFVIEKIESGRVVVKAGTYRFELKMQK